MSFKPLQTRGTRSHRGDPHPWCGHEGCSEGGGCYRNWFCSDHTGPPECPTGPAAPTHTQCAGAHGHGAAPAEGVGPASHACHRSPPSPGHQTTQGRDSPPSPPTQHRLSRARAPVPPRNRRLHTDSTRATRTRTPRPRDAHTHAAPTPDPPQPQPLRVTLPQSPHRHLPTRDSPSPHTHLLQRRRALHRQRPRQRQHRVEVEAARGARAAPPARARGGSRSRRRGRCGRRRCRRSSSCCRRYCSSRHVAGKPGAARPAPAALTRSQHTNHTINMAAPAATSLPVGAPPRCPPPGAAPQMGAPSTLLLSAVVVPPSNRRPLSCAPPRRGRSGGSVQRRKERKRLRPEAAVGQDRPGSVSVRSQGGGAVCLRRLALPSRPAVGGTMSALPRSYNPFAEEEDEETTAWPARGGGEASAAERQRSLQQEVLRRSAATADSTARSLSLLYESERIGVAASEVGRGGGRRAGRGTFSFPPVPGAALRLPPPGRGVWI